MIPEPDPDPKTVAESLEAFRRGDYMTTAHLLATIRPGGQPPDLDEPQDNPFVDDNAEFQMMAGHVRTIVETMLEKHFGERCPDFEPDCICCQRWKALDDLTANPYA